MNSIVISQDCPLLYSSLMGSDYLFRDGVGVKKLQEKYGVPSGINMNGTDLIPEVIDALKGRSVILIGATEENVNSAKSELYISGYNVIKAINGYEKKENILREMSNLKENNVLVIIGMGTPHQEIIADEIFDVLKGNEISSLIISGGAIIDRLAKSVKRSPDFFVKYHMEWFYRLCREPRRLFRRNLVAVVYLIKFYVLHGKSKLINKVKLVIYK